MRIFADIGVAAWSWCPFLVAAFIISPSPSIAFLSSPLYCKLQQRTQSKMSTPLQCESKSLIPPPPSISLPVWSLAAATVNPKVKQQTSMNIVTYAIPVSVAPPKLWMISLYHGTMTKESFLSTGEGVLQLLATKQKQLVFMGKQSGGDLTKSKAEICSEMGFTWTRDHPFGSVSLLPGCAGYIHLAVKDRMDAGDHVAVLCEVIQSGVWDEASSRIALSSNEVAVPLDQSEVLYSGLLRNEGLI